MQYLKIYSEDYLTPCEIRTLFRRRSGWSQRKMAASMNIPRHLYGEVERDKAETSVIQLEGGLKSSEKCYIYRRRAELKQTDIAQNLRVSVVWVNRMERGLVDCVRLLEYWET